MAQRGEEGEAIIAELTQGVGNDRELVIRDYLHEAAVAADHPVQNGLAELAGLTTPELIDLQIVSRALGFSASADVLDQAVSPIGLPVLRLSSATSSSAWASMASAMRSSARERSEGVASRQPGKAPAAAV